jgi:Fibronectin type III domain
LTPAPPGGRSLTVVATDTTGLFGSATVLVAVAPFDPPQNLKVFVNNPAGSATLSWAAPLNTGGAPVASYTVTTQPDTTTQSLGAAATSATVSGLSPGTTYIFSVIAINSAGISSSPASVIAQDIASPWRIMPSQGVSGTQNNLASVSCVSATFCAAVGDSTTQTLAEIWNGRRWSMVPSPTSGRSAFTGVSCLSARSCTAVGFFSDPVSGAPQALVEVWNGTSWSIVAAPNNSNNNYFPESVTCLSAKFCTLVGYQTPLGSNQQALVETWNGTAWSIVPTPNVSTTASLLDGVSCVSRTSCTAVGYFRNSSFELQPLIESWNGSTWSVVPTPSLGGTKNWLLGVSCVSAGYCMAVGFSAPTQTLVETWNGSSWSAVPSPNGSASEAELFGVSCLSASECTAVGFFNDSSAISHTLVEAWDGSSWSIVPSPDDNTDNLQGVSCLSTGPCTAVGQFFDASGFYFPLVEVS